MVTTRAKGMNIVRFKAGIGTVRSLSRSSSVNLDARRGEEFMGAEDAQSCDVLAQALASMV